MNPLVGILGKQPKPPLTLDDVARRLAHLEDRVKVLENHSLDDELQRGQHQKALESILYGIQEALTSGPVKFNAQDQKVWDKKGKV